MELPNDVWDYILKFASPSDLSAFEASCRSFKLIATARWKSIVKESLVEVEINDKIDAKFIFKK